MLLGSDLQRHNACEIMMLRVHVKKYNKFKSLYYDYSLGTLLTILGIYSLTSTTSSVHYKTHVFHERQIFMI